MDASASSSRLVRSESAQSLPSGRTPRPSATGKDQPDNDRNKTPSHRSRGYKEKFQALREQYERVTAANESYRRDLDNALTRIKGIQAENDLLLDAMNIAVMSQPGLIKFVEPLDLPLDPHTPPDAAAHMAHLRSQMVHANGHSNGHGMNGLAHHHPGEMHDGPQMEFVPHEGNGRMS